MAEDDKSSPSFDLRTVLLVAALVGGAYVIPSSLRSSRPSERETLERTAIGDQVVPARLWQDPFEVTMAYQATHREKIRDETKELERSQTNKVKVPFYSLAELCQQISRHSDSGRAPITILEVMISGGSYAEDAEQRHRDRYAVLSALHVAGFLPWDSEHIGYAQTDWPRGKELEKKPFNQIPTLRAIPKHPDSALIVPFEWFVPNQLSTDAQTNNDLLVLWLNDAAFDDHPLKRLAQLNHYLTEKTNYFQSPLPRLSFKMLQPRLRSVLNELASETPVVQASQKTAEIGLHDTLAGLQLYSSWSTTPDAVLSPRFDLPGRSAITNHPGCSGLSFYNVTCTDDQLIDELIDELCLRNVDVTKPEHRIILISEWDTFYGRSLPLTFAAAVKCRINDRFTADSFLDITNVFLLLKNPQGLIRSNIGHLLSAGSFPVSEYAYPTPAWQRALLKDLNALLGKDLASLARFPELATVPELEPLRHIETNNLSPGQKVHLNRLLLDNAFPNAIRPNSFAAMVNELKATPAAWPSNIVLCTYLRGIDGKVPGEADQETKSGKTDSKSSQASAETASGEDLQRPEGHSQLDYLPRLATSLADLEEDLKSQGYGEFKAIGILGSDVYDKLLVLQSLRREFTDELFFTTDLDARMLHPDALKWTRNVLVASSFGLELAAKFQKQIPPFRDTYQTGQYLACLAALNFPEVAVDVAHLVPRRYEIGSKGAFDLSLQDSPIHPPSPRPQLGEALFDKRNLGWLGIGIALALLAALFTQRARDIIKALYRTIFSSKEELPPPFTSGNVWQFRLVFWVPIAAVGFLCYSMVVDHCDRAGEPFSLSDGISVWPTELIRFLAAWLTLFFTFKAYLELQDSQTKLEKELGFPTVKSEDSSPSNINNRKPDGFSIWRIPKVLWREFQRVSIVSWKVQEKDSDDAKNETAKDDIYKDYSRLAGFRSRMVRVILPALVYGALFWLFYRLFDWPFQPTRGHRSYVWDCMVALFSSALLVFLVFFVVDASRLCRKFIDHLSEVPSKWPVRYIQKTASEYKMHESYLHEYVDLRVIAKRSDAVGKLIFYPFFILLLIIIARNNFFDRWDWPPTILLFLGLNSAYALYAVWSLRNAAENARVTLLDRLNRKLLAQDSNGVAEQIRLMIRKVKSCEEGAFAPVTQQPVIKAILMPFGGAGILALLNYLATK